MTRTDVHVVAQARRGDGEDAEAPTAAGREKRCDVVGNDVKGIARRRARAEETEPEAMILLRLCA
jgi:hypothetical protein